MKFHHLISCEDPEIFPPDLAQPIKINQIRIRHHLKRKNTYIPIN